MAADAGTTAATAAAAAVADTTAAAAADAHTTTAAAAAAATYKAGSLETLNLTPEGQGELGMEAVRTDGKCLARHQRHFEPSLLMLNGNI